MIRFISIGIKPRQTSTVGQNAQSEINIGFIVLERIVIKIKPHFVAEVTDKTKIRNKIWQHAA